MYIYVFACRRNQSKSKLGELELVCFGKFVEIRKVGFYCHKTDTREVWAVTRGRRRSPDICLQRSCHRGVRDPRVWVFRKNGINQSALQMVLPLNFLPLTECRKWGAIKTAGGRDQCDRAKQTGGSIIIIAVTASFPNGRISSNRNSKGNELWTFAVL